MKRIRQLIPVALIATGLFAVGTGAARADLLDDIQKAKKIRVAVNLGTPLFSFAGADLKPTGSDVETARMVAADLGVAVDWVEITTAARVPTIQTGKADILVASLGITAERLKAIDFSVPYATLDIIVAAPDAMAVPDYASLAGKRIGLTRATVNDTLVTQNAKGAEIVRFEDDATLISASVSGQVDIVSTQPPLIAVMNERRPDRPLKTKFVMRELNLGIALPQNEPRLKAWLDDWVRKNMANGRLPAMFAKFHDRQLPKDLADRKVP
jgi:polar amino acid transport system substrate-binding protein